MRQVRFTSEESDNLTFSALGGSKRSLHFSNRQCIFYVCVLLQKHLRPYLEMCPFLRMLAFGYKSVSVLRDGDALWCLHLTHVRAPQAPFVEVRQALHAQRALQDAVVSPVGY